MQSWHPITGLAPEPSPTTPGPHPTTTISCLQGGYIQACPAGTYCAGSLGGESPCKSVTTVTTLTAPLCYGEGVCCSDYEYCSGGRRFSCKGGSICEGGFPCVWSTEVGWLAGCGLGG